MNQKSNNRLERRRFATGAAALRLFLQGEAGRKRPGRATAVRHMLPRCILRTAAPPRIAFSDPPLPLRGAAGEGKSAVLDEGILHRLRKAGTQYSRAFPRCWVGRFPSAMTSKGFHRNENRLVGDGPIAMFHGGPEGRVSVQCAGRRVMRAASPVRLGRPGVSNSAPQKAAVETRDDT